MTVRIGGALLAAGASTRLGRPKQLLDYGGRPLIAHVLAQLSAAPVSDVAVVLGSSSETVAAALAGDRCERLDNPGWAEGIASSIRVAVAWARARRFDALLLAACDQPRLTSDHIRALCEAYDGKRTSVASGYGQTCGIPAVFDASWYARLLSLRGDRGAGALLRSDECVYVIAWPDGGFDVDTEADARVLGA